MPSWLSWADSVKPRRLVKRRVAAQTPGTGRLARRLAAWTCRPDPAGRADSVEPRRLIKRRLAAQTPGAGRLARRLAVSTGRPRPVGRVGFTLIELAVTLALVLVLAAIALPRFAEAYGNFRAESILRDLEKEIRYAQYHAVMEGRRLLFRYDRSKNTYELLQEKKKGPSVEWIPVPAPWGRRKKIPDAFTLSTGGKQKILFFPDGTVSETALALRSGSEDVAVLEIGRTLRGAVIVRKRSHAA